MRLPRFNRQSRKIIGLCGVLGLALCSAAPAASYDAVTDFSLASNPNGVWSYGSLSAYTGGTFSLYASTMADANFPGSQVWYNGQSQPNTAAVLRDNSDSTATNGGSVFYYPGLLELDGENLITAVRWTAPAAGTYNVAGLFQRTDNSGNGPVSVRVVENSTTVLFSADSFVTFGSQQTFNLTNLSLPAGTTLNFAQGAAQFNNDSTGLAVTISTSLPNTPTIHLTNASSQGAVATLNAGSPFTTDFKASNDVTITSLVGPLDPVYTDNFARSPTGNNPGYLVAYLGSSDNGTGTSTVGDFDFLQTHEGTPFTSLQFDFARPLGTGDRIIVADVDTTEEYQVKAYHLVSGSYQALSLTGWKHEQFSGQTGISPDSTFSTWDPSAGTLTSNANSGNLNEPLDVFTPDKPVDRLVITQTAGTSGNAGIQVIEVSQPPVITSANTLIAHVGTAFTYQIKATGNPTSYGVGGLFAGIMVNKQTGLISGTPTATGTHTLTLQAANAFGTGTQTLTVTVKEAVPVITSTDTLIAHVGTAFTYQIKATNNPTSYGVSGLFSGVTVNQQTGLISGTPTAAGTHTLTLRAINSGGTGTATLTLTVKEAIPVISSPASAAATAGKAFSYQIKASNSPTSYGVGGLFSGITVNQTTGLISGTPTAAGTHMLILRATNAGGTGDETLTLTVNPN